MADNGGEHGPSWLVSASWGGYHIPNGCGQGGGLGSSLRDLTSGMRAGGVQGRGAAGTRFSALDSDAIGIVGDGAASPQVAVRKWVSDGGAARPGWAGWCAAHLCGWRRRVKVAREVNVARNMATSSV